MKARKSVPCMALAPKSFMSLSLTAVLVSLVVVSSSSARADEESPHINSQITVQVDGRFDFSENDGVHSLEIRRGRPTLTLRGYDGLSGRIMLEFGRARPQLLDAYSDLRLTDWLWLRVGRFKVQLGQEFVQTLTNRHMEMGLASMLVARRDIGFGFRGQLLDQRLSYFIGVFNGPPDGSSLDWDLDDGKDLNLRLFAHPFRGLDGWLSGIGVGVATTVGFQSGDADSPRLASYAPVTGPTMFRFEAAAGETSAGSLYADGLRWRVTPQVTWYTGRFGMQGELTVSTHTITWSDEESSETHEFMNWGYHAMLLLMLTDDEPSFGLVSPNRPFDTSAGNWGAVELVARFAQINFDQEAFPRFASRDSSVAGAMAMTSGINWHLNRAYRLSAYWERTMFDGGVQGGADRSAEDLLLVRMQLNY